MTGQAQAKIRGAPVHRNSHPNRKRKYWKSQNRNEGFVFNRRVLKGFKEKGRGQKGYIQYY